jgi:hypothetical protein
LGQGAGIDNFTALAEKNPGGENVMAVLEDVHPDGHGLAHHRFRRVTMGRRRA